jgi:hypothetical protein
MMPVLLSRDRHGEILKNSEILSKPVTITCWRSDLEKFSP